MCLLLALFVASAALPPVSRADDEQPDLQIEVVGLKAGSKRDVVVRVTNISIWWSDRTVARVEVVAPNPGQVRSFDVPDMNTKDEAPLPHVFEFTYTLAEDCNGHVVKATLSAGSNYEGVKETKLDNNVAQRAVCSGTGTSSGAGTTSLPAGVTAPGAKPERFTPGTRGPATTETVVNEEPAVRGGLAPGDQAFRLISAQTAPGTYTIPLPLALRMRRGASATFHGGFASAECFPIGRWNLEPKFVVG
jgi:hypothetical protein